METKQKAKKELYVSLALIACSLIMIIGATIAWFAVNREVESSGLKTNFNVTPSMVMGTTTGAFTMENLTLTTVLNQNMYYLKPSTHSASGYANGGVGLIYITNPKNVDDDTGYVISGKTLSYQPVPVYGTENKGRRFYMDYDAYICSENVEMVVTALNVSLVYTPNASSDPQTLSNLTSETQYIKASSIDFYLNGTAQSNYVGTLNFAGIDITKNESAQKEGQKTTLDLLINESNKVIPCKDDKNSQALHVVMRFYFDGALKNPATGNAYVHTNGFEIGNFHISVKYDAIEPGQ